jgi:gas vesicle protein
MAVGENIRLHYDRFAEYAFGRKPAGVDFGFDTFYNGSFPPIQKWVFKGAHIEVRPPLEEERARTVSQFTRRCERPRAFARPFTMGSEDTMRPSNGSNVLWFLAGVMVGAAATMMLTPVRGAETRRLITEGATNARGFVQESGREYLEKGRELYEQGKQLADEAAEMFEDGRRLVEGVET